jgi:hypothetical protein
MVNFKQIYKHPREWSLVKDMTLAGWRVAILACLGAMVFGYDTAWLATRTYWPITVFADQTTGGVVFSECQRLRRDMVFTILSRKNMSSRLL